MYVWKMAGLKYLDKQCYRHGGIQGPTYESFDDAQKLRYLELGFMWAIKEEN